MDNRIIDFFKYLGLYNKDSFDEISKNTKILDKPYDEIKYFVGCYVLEDGTYKLVLPKINSIFDELIYVHEYTHALFLNNKSEILPNMMEVLYIEKYVKSKAKRKEIIKRTKEELNNTIDYEHFIAKKIKIRSLI